MKLRQKIVEHLQTWLFFMILRKTEGQVLALVVQQIVKWARSQFRNCNLGLYIFQRRHQLLIFKLLFNQAFD